MICAPCAHAGDRTQGLRRVDVDRTETHSGAVEIMLDQAREMHATCKGCNCQHRVPTIDELRRRAGPIDRLTGVS